MAIFSIPENIGVLPKCDRPKCDRPKCDFGTPDKNILMMTDSGDANKAPQGQYICSIYHAGPVQPSLNPLSSG
ncbi:hypothetical protein [Desulfonema magnum]|uniref:Uncharacterized protein n=1 Tax=Desulfonema magnum TaxID=45655 RepID=A0A975BQX1_9BACT|nr:hypothetical protein [Desulfonema magnum]QTA89425.1 Uncharacterized protein dnm_054780 [Desulfonema magnum]